MGIQDDAAVTCAAYRVTENGQTWCFTTSPSEELLDAAQTLRRYSAPANSSLCIRRHSPSRRRSISS